MRIVLIAATVLIALVLCVVAIGAFLPKHHLASRSAAYRATPEQLFALIAGTQAWRTGVTHSEIVSDADGRELLRETARDGQTITYEVLDRMPPTSLKRRIVTENLPYSGTWTYSLQPQGQLTIVRITEDGQVYSPVFRFVSRFILGPTSTLDAYLRALGKATGQEVEIKN
jgi:hypothetical protein